MVSEASDGPGGDDQKPTSDGNDSSDVALADGWPAGGSPGPGSPDLESPRLGSLDLGTSSLSPSSFGTSSLGSLGLGRLSDTSPGDTTPLDSLRGGGSSLTGDSAVKTPELPTSNLAELAQLLALAIAQNQTARSTPTQTNSELTSLATLVSNTGPPRTLAPVFKDGLSALSYARPPSQPNHPLPSPQSHMLDDDEPMPIPSTWRQPAPREDEGWFRQQMGAALLGLVAGLMIVVPSVLWMSGWLDGARTGASGRTAAASLEPKVPEVKTMKVQVRPVDKPVETAAQFVTGSLEPQVVPSASRPVEPSAVEASAAEAREAEAREAEAREAQAREAEARVQAAREAEAREAEARAAAARMAEARAAEARAAEARAAEARAAEARVAQARAAEARAAAVKLAEARARQEALLVRARQRVDTGDISGAREILAAGDDGAQGPVLFALAETYDPNMLAAWGTRGVTADVARARALYQKALGLGVASAQNRLDALK